jgi:hypothetical protein
MQTYPELFFCNMAEQFKAGMELAIDGGPGSPRTVAGQNAVQRDIDSFTVEAQRWFPKEFNTEAFKARLK